MCDVLTMEGSSRQSSVILGRLNTRKSLILLTFSTLDN
jgi:hypothetical protein